ncbi:MAG: hypothetical protein II677_01165 [Muribaculaceae bacterium]|nr:hypothetical protein [Muribaculaceae bacterium]
MARLSTLLGQNDASVAVVHGELRLNQERCHSGFVDTLEFAGGFVDKSAHAPGFVARFALGMGNVNRTF